MAPLWQTVVAIVASILVLWAVLVVMLYVASRRGSTQAGANEALRLLPDVLRLVRRLASDGGLPRRTRWALWGVLGYLLLPIDLVPDFLPVVGQADDVILVALVLRSVLRAAGRDVIEQHWPGTPTGLDVVLRLTGTAASRRG